MTKAIRIENADNSAHKIQVRVMQRGVDGAPDTQVGDPIDLSSPTQLIQQTIWNGRYIVVEEI